MTSSGQSIGDRLAAAQHTIVGSDLNKSVLKASTTEIMGPKKKHLEYLQSLTCNPNINIVELADSIVERTKNTKWVVVFKALITTHHLTCFGHERFLQHLASRNTLFNLTAFNDKSGVQGYDMSAYIRKYARYLNEKAISYRMVAYDFTRVKRGKEGGQLKMLTADKLLKTLPIIQQQLDALLEFDATANELTNGVINAAFYMLFKDLIRLFACYNDGIINLLEKFFEMKKAHCKEGLDLYKKFLTRTGKVSELLKVAEQVGIDKGDIPDLTKAPSSLLDALEQHIASLDGKKLAVKPASKAGTPVHIPASKPTPTQAAAPSKVDVVQQAVADEAAVFNKLMSTKSSEQQQSVPAPAAAQPQPAAAPSFSAELAQFDLLTSSPTSWNTTTTQQPPQQDLFAFNNAQQPQQQQSSKPFDDLFGTSDLLTPIAPNGQSQMMVQQQPQATNGTSLDSTMANVLANLTQSSGPSQQSFMPTQQPKLTGGNNFQMNTPAMTTMGAAGNGMGGYQQMGMMRPPLYQQQPMMQSYNPMMMQQQQQMFMQQQVTNPFQQQQPQQPPQQLNANNPFGSMM